MKVRLGMGLLALLGLVAGWLWFSESAPQEREERALEGTQAAPRPSAPALMSAGRPPAKGGAEPHEERGATPEVPPEPEAPALFVVRGRALSAATGGGIAGAEIRAHVGEQHWGLRRSGPSVVQTRTAADGRYELTFPLPHGEKQLVTTALARGYRTPHAWPEGEEGGGEGGPQDTRIRATPGGEGLLDFHLLPGLDVGGVVIDGEGRPIPGVEIVVSENTKSSTGYLEFPVTDNEGRFRVHDLPTLPFHKEGMQGTLDFDHPEHQAARIEDVYALPAGERAALRVVMPRGVTLRGTLSHANGEPAEDVLIAAYLGESNTGRRGVRTDAQGGFEMRGLTPGALVLRAHSGARLSFLRREIQLLRTEDDLQLRLVVAPLARALPRERILGLEVVALPPAARKEFDLYKAHALMVTAIVGDVPEGLAEHVRVGDILWDIGGVDCTSVLDVMRGVVKRADWWTNLRKGETPARYSIRYVLGMRRPDLDGTYTGGMKLTPGVVETFRQYLRDHPEPEGE